ncbi:DNA polymerase III subunit beta [Desulfatitalea alkaliphila]|uniref:Beta sliding clamp n=1 Tax=Desulfatitalea alkaliphila TaxID=2929485 RepID=A0AA41UKX3_9BACT|nr:DNA polymerase III subunit beta [Desulfatitalea alkaliphila]MCJ8500896.1 DNA polymerase III subunit beta [Desulfatitalea alkaliphila]
MKFTINKRDIVDVMGKVQGLTGRRSSLAITECVRIQGSEDRVQITATDLETCYEGTFPAQVENSGTIAIAARKFYEIVREFPAADIMIQEAENRWINIGDKKVHYHLMGMNPDDFPNTPFFEAGEMFDIPSADLKKMIEKSIVISGIGEDKKAHINGVLFERLTEETPKRLRMVSTDGSRLSKYDYRFADDQALPAGEAVIVPKKGLHEVSKFLGAGGNVQVAIEGSYFIVKAPAETLAIRLLEGQFPKYGDIIFRSEGYAIEMDKDKFHNMLKRMSILCTDSYRAAFFTFDADQLVINATNPDIGESKEDMPIAYTGPKMEAGFNPRFFIEALNCVEDEKLIVNILNDEKPCLLEGVTDKSYLGVIMPMRV